MTPTGIHLLDLTAQFLVTMAFLGLGLAGYLALGTAEMAVGEHRPKSARRRAGRRAFGTGGGPVCDDCGQIITFAVMVDTDRRLPIDPHPIADGNVCAQRIGRHLRGYVITDQRPPSGAPGFRRYAAHFGTCPDRAKPGKPRRPKPEPPATLPGLS